MPTERPDGPNGKPNPGSNDARRAGCTCPVMDNNHGMWKPWQGGWLIEPDCPIHGDGRELAPA